jgi:XTP/dITP diphosphohydrolase
VTDRPGARLLDVVAVMDRLRSPGGCPWDAAQTHESLMPYLLEEAYEAYAALEDRDGDALREELGDVLLQVVFHARLAQERDDGWTIDDVAAGLVDKLTRRHPHVFGSASAQDAAAVERSWDALKAAEKGRTSVTEGIPLSQPSLALAARLQKRGVRAGLPADLVTGTAAQRLPDAVAAAAARVEEAPDAEAAVGDLLFEAVALARSRGVDPEAALRGRARAFRDHLAAVEAELAAEGRDREQVGGDEWRVRWRAVGPG